jgi:polygalacturonase
MKCIKIVLLLCLQCLSFTSFSQSTYNIINYGAVADGKTMNTKSIQKAIDQCAAKGGGQVLIPNGTFITGSIFLKSNVTLYLDASAVLQGSADSSDYLPNGRPEKALISAIAQNNIGIYGRGVINGNGEHKNFYSPDKGNGLPGRPNTLAFYRSNNIKLKEFTLKNGTRWDIQLKECDFVTADDIKVLSRVVANNDGIDVVDCHNTTITNSYFDCGDDGICPKSESARGVKKLVISNCIVKSESNAIKCGTSGIGGFEDVTITNCVLYDTRLSGLALELVDGGVMNRVAISNITMHNVNGSIFIKLGKRKGDTPGVLKNVYINNIIADGIGHWQADTAAYYFKPAHEQRIGMSIVGQPGYAVENVSLTNICLQFAGGGTTADAARTMNDRPAVYPEYTNFGITPAYGINCKYVKDLYLHNITLDYAAADARPAVYLDNINNADISALKARASANAPAFIVCANTDQLFVHGCKPSGAAIPFLSIKEQSKGITIINNDCKSIKGVYVADAGSKGEVYSSGNRE